MIRLVYLIIRMVFLLPLATAWAGQAPTSRSVHFSISRHLGDFKNCRTALLAGEPKSVFSVDNNELDKVTTQASSAAAKVQQFYFSEMQRRKTLSEAEAAYYASLTYELDPTLVSFVSSSVNGAYDSALMVVSGQRLISHSRIGVLDKHKLPFERQFPGIQADRSDDKLVWEIGRARGGEFFRTNGALAALLMMSEVAEHSFPTYFWYLPEELAEKCVVYIHATTKTHATLYQSARYGFSLYKTVKNTDNKTSEEEYILSISLKKFLEVFNAYESFEKLTGMASRLKVSPEKAFEIYLNVKRHLAPTYYDYHPKGKTHAQEPVPHYYPKLIQVSSRTAEKRKTLASLFRDFTGKSLKQIQNVFDFSSPIEWELLSLFRGKYTCKQIFGTDNLVFVDGIDSGSFDKEDLSVLLANLYGKYSVNGQAPKKFIFRTSSENPILGTLYQLGAKPVPNPMPLRDQVLNWVNVQRPQWVSISEEDRRNKAAGFLEIAKMFGTNPYYFYKNSYDWPTVPDQLMSIDIETMKELYRTVRVPDSVLFQGELSSQYNLSVTGGL